MGCPCLRRQHHGELPALKPTAVCAPSRSPFSPEIPWSSLLHLGQLIFCHLHFVTFVTALCHWFACLKRLHFFLSIFPNRFWNDYVELKFFFSIPILLNLV